MPDEPTSNATPVPLRPHVARQPSPAPQSVVTTLHASLRATEVYVRILIDRIELAPVSDVVQLNPELGVAGMLTRARASR